MSLDRAAREKLVRGAGCVDDRARRRTDRARPGDRRRRSRTEHEARLRGCARDAARPCGQAAAGAAEGDRHDAGDEGRRRLRAAGTAPSSWSWARRSGAAGARRSRRGGGQGDRRRQGARAFGGGAENHARCAGAGAGRTCAGAADCQRDCGRGGASRRSHDADAGDPRPGIVPRRTLHRPYGPGRRARRPS